VTQRWSWLIVGTAVLVLLCASLFADRGALAPYPVHQVLLVFLTQYGFLIVLPVAYLVSLGVLWNNSRFSPIVVGAAALFATLNIAWFAFAWRDARNHEDASIVMFENVVGSGLVLALAIVGHMRSSKQAQVAAYFGIFAMLSWCAFPYFGELP
jgi:hypothetical protein